MYFFVLTVTTVKHIKIFIISVYRYSFINLPLDTNIFFTEYLTKLLFISTKVESWKENKNVLSFPFSLIYVISHGYSNLWELCLLCLLWFGQSKIQCNPFAPLGYNISEIILKQLTLLYYKHIYNYNTISDNEDIQRGKE